MKNLIIKSIAVIKAIVLWMRPHLLLGFLRHPMLFLSNLLELTRWISRQDKKNTFNDYFTFRRDYDKREKLYQYVLDSRELKNIPIDYLEFGVCGGHSFRWWTDANTHPDSRFYGFDTFEGLPENWGPVFKKGSMNAAVPESADERATFVKGLFQDTLPGFLKENHLRNEHPIVVLLDADLFSSTLFALGSLSSFLKPGDIVLFDEFNVPNHEFFAFRIFTQSHYHRFELIGAVNNYYQVAFVVK